MLRKTISVVCLVLFITLCSFRLQTTDGYYNIIYIGDSITQAGQVKDAQTYGPAAQSTAYLLKKNIFKNVQFSNQGRSGFTTVDFLPSSKKAYPKVIEAANTFYNEKSATLLFSIMLGTNDSAIKGPNGSPVSPEQYHDNLKTLTDSLFKRYPDCKVIYHNPIWYSDSTHNRSTYLVEGRERLQSYRPQLKLLVNEYKTIHPGQVFLGDKKGFKYFKKHYLTDMNTEKGPSGVFYLHPNQKGSASLGELWGKAIAKALK
ncbi:MAG: GDSL-type esterase/lipase family protein [Mucilaginibacter sp.]|uniref:GDSL-type esterase/lipase family protein n=1 Tax=Mucilaginibacter sp. TaxID=1882438 RepID=UPI0032653DE0